MAKDTLSTGKFTFNSSPYDVTDFTYNEDYGQIDVTDTGTTGDGKEYLGGRKETTFEVGLICDLTDADLTMNTEYAAIIDFEGKTYSGNAVLLTKAITASIDDAVKAKYTGRFNGTVSITPVT
jgi:predicted secreted protein